MFRKILVLTIFLAATAIVATPAAAQATGATNVSIDLPSMVILYYRTSVELAPTEAVMQTLIGEAGDAVSGAGVTLTDFSGDATVDGSEGGYTAPTTVLATIDNFWAVRSLGSGNTTVDVAWNTATPTATLTNPDSDTIDLTALQTQAATGGTWGASDSFPSTGLGAGGPMQGDVRFTVDLTGADTAGVYAGASVVITATSI